MVTTIPLLVGYLASVLLAFSLLVNNDLRFRWFNLGGNVCFITYGLFIHAVPILLTNAILLLINVYRLVRLYSAREDFDLMEFQEDGKIIPKFFAFYAKDIHKYFPEFRLQDEHYDIKFVVLRDMAIANIFIATLSEDGTAEVKFNYTIPKYRDYKVGRYIFEKENRFLISKGVQRIVYKKVSNKQHEKFLKVMGFEAREMDGSVSFEKVLARRI